MRDDLKLPCNNLLCNCCSTFIIQIWKIVKKINKTKDDLDTSQRCCLVSSACIKLGQCRTPGITYFFITVDVFMAFI